MPADTSEKGKDIEGKDIEGKNVEGKDVVGIWGRCNMGSSTCRLTMGEVRRELP